MPSQFSFLEDRLLQALRAKGFDALSSEDQAALFPQFVAEGERRFGLALMPALEKQGAVDAFIALAQKPEATVEDWQKFWSQVPNFNAIVERAIADYIKEIAVAFAL